MPRHASRAFFRSLAMACLVVSGHAAGFFSQHLVPNPVVVEFRNRIVDHYFLTADPAEIAGIDAGAAGPGWDRTGFGFFAWGLNDLGQSCSGCEPVARFYGTPGLGPNSHFFTAHAEEAAGLKRPRSGWSFEKNAFHALLPDGPETCPHGLTPVYRLYNGRWRVNDSNHRYVTGARERDRMRAAGWADEGAKFCVLNSTSIPLKTFDVRIALESAILPSAQCEDESSRLGSCLAINSLVPPTTPYAIDPSASAVFARLSGIMGTLAYTSLGPYPATAEYTAQQVFVMGAGDWVGIHVDTHDRPSTSYASINPLYQFRTTASPSGPDERFFPFRDAGFPLETELSIRFSLIVLKVAVKDGSSHAYGHPTIEFIDQRSGQHVYFTALAYGIDTGSDYLAPDIGTGKVIVGTTFRESSPYGRSIVARTLNTPPGFYGHIDGVFDYRMDRADFQRVIDSARRVNPALSSDPSDYLVDNFHFNNEVVGNAEIGMALGGFSLRLMPRS